MEAIISSDYARQLAAEARLAVAHPEVQFAAALHEARLATTRLPLRRWFDRHDPHFQDPFKALAAGYTFAELAAEYAATFSSERYAMQQLAIDLKHYLGSI